MVLSLTITAEDSPALRVLAEVAAERARQDARWGVQNHPSVYESAVPCDSSEVCAWYMLPSPADAQATCERRFGNGVGAYADILVEEVCEAIGAPDDDARRAELVQVAAVAVAMIEAIDRRKGAR